MKSWLASLLIRLCHPDKVPDREDDFIQLGEALAADFHAWQALKSQALTSTDSTGQLKTAENPGPSHCFLKALEVLLARPQSATSGCTRSERSERSESERHLQLTFATRFQFSAYRYRLDCKASPHRVRARIEDVCSSSSATANAFRVIPSICLPLMSFWVTSLLMLAARAILCSFAFHPW